MTTARPLHPADVFPLLHGTWNLDRTIPGHATMRGQATFTPVPPTTQNPVTASPPDDMSSRPEQATQPAAQWRDPQPPATNPATLYTEQVRIHTTTGASLTGTAHYRFTRRPDGNIDVHLPATGALFHTLSFAPTPDGSLEARATHLCAADTYTSTYRLLSPNHLTIEHTVRGPRKHYTAQTTLHRTPPTTKTQN